MDLQIKQNEPDIRPADSLDQQKSDPVEFVPERVVAYDILEFVTDQRLKRKTAPARQDRSLRPER